MSKHSIEMHRCIRECDIGGYMKLTDHINPDLAPKDSWQAAFCIHVARTGMRTMPEKLRMYSHCWLRDSGMEKQSLLPDKMKPKAERLYPVGARAVGIATRTQTGRAMAIRGVMEDAVRECEADGYDLNNRKVVHGRMLEMRQKFIRHADGIAARLFKAEGAK